MPLLNVNTYRSIMATSLWAPRMGASLLLIFAALSLVLAVVGIYGVMAYAVNQRTREIGIRMALGADRSAVLRMVVLQALRLTLLGVAVGLAAAFAASRLIANLLINVSPTDVVTFVAVPVVLSLAALAASYIPARRATRIDPMIALRYE
jgi:putative ABC transport system permease protein